MAADRVWVVRVDGRRRLTLPPDLVEAAGISPGEQFTARVDGAGRIVLESSRATLGRVKEEIRRGPTPSRCVVDEFLEERRGRSATGQGHPRGTDPADSVATD